MKTQENGQSLEIGSSAGFGSVTEREREVLKALKWGVDKNQGPRGDGWMRPMDIGGSNGSHHHRTLQILVKRGLVECRRRCVSMVAALGSSRAGREYRVLPKHRSQRRGPAA